MFYEIYNVQRKHSKVTVLTLRVLLTVLCFIRVINGYCRYGKVTITEDEDSSSYYIKLEEVVK